MCAQSCLTLCNSMDCRPPALLSMGFSGKNTGMGCHFFLQGIFPILGSNLCLLRLLYWHVDSLPLSRKLLWPSINFKLLKKKKNYQDKLGALLCRFFGPLLQFMKSKSEPAQEYIFVKSCPVILGGNQDWDLCLYFFTTDSWISLCNLHPYPALPSTRTSVTASQWQ